MKTVTSTLRRLIKTTAMIFAVVFCGTAAASDVSPSSFRQELDRQLIERSGQYFESLRRRTAGLSPEFREKAERQALTVIKEGLERFGRPVSPACRNTGACQAGFVEALQRLGRFHTGDGLFAERYGTYEAALRVGGNIPLKIHTKVDNALSFLSRNYRQPTTWDIDLRRALPSRFYRIGCHGAWTRNCPVRVVFFGSTGQNVPGIATVTSSPSIRHFFQNGFVRLADSADLSAREDAGFRFTPNGDFLAGFPRIAQMIVLRI